MNKKEFGAGARQDQDEASVWEGCRVVPQVEVVQVLTAAEVIQIGDMDFPKLVKLSSYIDISASALHITVKLTKTHYVEHCGLAECLQRHVLKPPLPQEAMHMQFWLSNSTSKKQNVHQKRDHAHTRSLPPSSSLEPKYS